MKARQFTYRSAALAVAFGVLQTSQIALSEGGETRPLRETNVMIFSQDVAPGSFTQAEFEAIREVRGMETAASVNVMTSHSNVAGKATRFPLNIVYLRIDENDQLVGDCYSINNLRAPNGDWLNAWGELTLYYEGPKAGTFDGVWHFTGGTGRFEGVTGEGTCVGTFGDDPTQYVATGVISTCGSNTQTRRGPGQP